MHSPLHPRKRSYIYFRYCCVSGARAALVQRHGQAVRPLRIAAAAQQRTEHVLFRNLDREDTGAGIFGRAEERAAVIARLLPRGGDVFDGNRQSLHGTSYPGSVRRSSQPDAGPLLFNPELPFWTLRQSRQHTHSRPRRRLAPGDGRCAKQNSGQL